MINMCKMGIKVHENLRTHRIRTTIPKANVIQNIHFGTL